MEVDEEQKLSGAFRILWVFRPLDFGVFMLLYAAYACLMFFVPSFPQIYWAGLWYYWLFPFFALLNLVVTLRVFLTREWRPYRREFRGSIFPLLAANMLFWVVLACPGPAHGMPRHEDTIQVDNHVYHLRGASSFTYQFDLFKCDRFGITCHRVHHKYGMDETARTKLSYNPDNNQIEILYCGSRDPAKDQFCSVDSVYSLQQ